MALRVCVYDDSRDFSKAYVNLPERLSYYLALDGSVDYEEREQQLVKDLARACADLLGQPTTEAQLFETVEQAFLENPEL